MPEKQPLHDCIPNPERGFVRWLDDTGDARSIFRAGHRLVFTRFDLSEFRQGPISNEGLARIEERLSRVEAAGLKAVVRFQYADKIGEPDAQLPTVLGHIGQLADIFAAYSPVISVVQAGFIGAWGEWHSSTSGLENNSSYREIVRELLDVLPSERCIQVRAPRYKREVAGLRPLSVQTAYSGSPAARIGLHNDCFLSDEDDSGTFAAPVRSDRKWAAAEGLFVPIGGETCRLSRRCDGDNAVREIRMFHYSFLSQDWHPDVIQHWEAAAQLQSVELALGYRYVLESIEAKRRYRKGERFALSVNVVNHGAAAMYNPRPVHVVLDNGQQRVEVPLRAADPRMWLPATVRRLSCEVNLPCSMEGRWRVSLWLPDAAQTLRHRAEYAVRFANDGVWDPATGLNEVCWIDIEAP